MDPSLRVQVDLPRQLSNGPIDQLLGEYSNVAPHAGVIAPV